MATMIDFKLKKTFNDGMGITEYDVLVKEDGTWVVIGSVSHTGPSLSWVSYWTRDGMTIPIRTGWSSSDTRADAVEHVKVRYFDVKNKQGRR